MRTKAIATGLLAVALLSACGTATSSPSPSPSPSPCASPAGGADQSQEPSGSPSGCPGGAGSGSGAGGGGFDGSITRKWSEAVTQSGDGFSSVVTQAYEAVVGVMLVNGDIGSWDITGRADITSTFTSDVTARMANILGEPCNTHYTDDASGSGTVTVTGGLEARDGFYQFFVDIPGVDGSSDTVRDDSACGGPNNRETVPWSVAPISAAGNGDLTDPSFISGSFSAPREGGEDTVIWSFSLPD